MHAFASLSLAAALIAGFAHPAHAQTQSAAGAPTPYEPESGQPGKDVVWVPTPQVVVDKMLEIARVTPRDFVMDLGSGDGRTVITAAKRGTRALGIEYNPDMVEYAKRNAERAGVTDKAAFIKADLFETSLEQATVITMFLLPDINLRLRSKILALKPGTRIVSNTFTMGDWEPDERVILNGEPGCDNAYCSVLFWLVPRKVAGTYSVPQGQVTLKQEFQKLTGTLKPAEGTAVKLVGRVRGENIELNAGGKRYLGRLNGSVLELREAT